MTDAKIIKSILKKWKIQKTFIRFVDGNTLNCNISNLMYVNTQDIYLHFDEWKVDWDMNLTENEIAYVKLHPELLIQKY